LACFDRKWARRAFAPFHALVIPSTLFSLVVAWGVLQVSGWTPEEWASSISAADALRLPSPSRRIALDAQQQWTAILLLLTYAAVFLLAIIFSERAPDAKQVLKAVVVVATLTTLYSMVVTAVNAQSHITGVSFWVPHEGYFSGTLISPNNYGTYAGMAALTSLALGLPPIDLERGAVTARERWRRRLTALGGGRSVWLALTPVLCMGVLLSGSRAAATSLLLGLIAVVVLHVRGWARWALVPLIPIAAVIAAALVPNATRLLERAMSLLLHGAPGRDELYAAALRAIALRPATGWGMNSFPELYNVFQPVTLEEYFDKVHNTYLELAFDLGVPAAVALLVSVGLLVWRCFVGFRRRHRDRELPALAISVSVLAGFHSLFDFSLQIPGVACTYFALLGVAWSQSWRAQDRS
jgi:O-antigen ligase